MKNGCWIDSLREIVSEFCGNHLDIALYWFQFRTIPVSKVYCTQHFIYERDLLFLLVSSVFVFAVRSRKQHRLRQESKYWSRYWYFRSKFYMFDFDCVPLRAYSAIGSKGTIFLSKWYCIIPIIFFFMFCCCFLWLKLCCYISWCIFRHC